MNGTRVVVGLVLMLLIGGSTLHGMDLNHGTFILRVNPVSNATRQDLISCQGYILGLLLERRDGRLSFCSYNKARIAKPEWEGNDLILPIPEDGKTTFVGLTWDVKAGKHLIAWREGEAPRTASRNVSYVQTDLDKATSYEPTFGYHQTADGEIGVYAGSKGPLKKLFEDDRFRSLDDLKTKMLEFVKVPKEPSTEPESPAAAEYFARAQNHFTSEQAVNAELVNLAQEKLNLLGRAKGDKQISAAEVAKLQSAFREIGVRIQRLQAEKKAAADHFAEITRDFKAKTLMGGGLTPDQKAAIQAAAKASARENSLFTALNARANEGLLILAKNLNLAWDGLEMKLNALKDRQEAILKLQKEILALSGNKVLATVTRKRLLELRSRLNTLMGEEAGLLADLVGDFARTGKVYPADDALKAKMSALLDERQRLQKVIQDNNSKIDEFFRSNEVAYGDLDKDGKYDKDDEELMDRYRNYGIVPKGYSKPQFIKLADLNGDGKVDKDDRQLLKDVRNHDRITFPVNSIPGDLDGDGKLDSGDLEIAQKMAVNPHVYSQPAWRKLADMDGNGKVNLDDVILLRKKVDETRGTKPPILFGEFLKPPALPKDADADGGSTEATGVVTDAPSDQGQSQGQSADGIDSAY